jgi:hypothetical protein
MFQLIHNLSFRPGASNGRVAIGERLAVRRARLIAGLSDAQLGHLERGPLRWLIVRTLPVAMPLMFSRKAARGVGGAPVSGTVELALRRRDGGESDVFSVVIADGRCRVRRGPAARPRASISIGLIDGARMGSGAVDPAFYLADGIAAGRISLSGDVFLFLAFPNLFRMPNRKLI